MEKKLAWIRPFLKGEWLDAGSGSGEFANAMSRHARVSGIDISGTAVKKASRKFPKVNFRQAGVEKIPFRNCSLDGIVAFEVIEHVLDTEAMFSEFNRVLKRQGMLCITTPQLTRLKALAIALSCLDSYFEPESPHIRYYTLKNLERELSSHGFEIVRSMPDGSFLPGIPKGIFVAARKIK